MTRLGVIGIGNMGEAILRGACSGGALKADETFVFDHNPQKAEPLHREFGVRVCSDIDELFENSTLILLAVKPLSLDTLAEEKYDFFAEKGVISIVAGRSGERLASMLPQSTRILRTMPNTPALVGEGMVVFEDGDTLLQEERDFAERLFGAVGKVERVTAHLMDAVTGISGSGPAYVDLFIEALADAGVRAGLPRAMAYRLSAQTVYGSAKLVLETGEAPAVLKDKVCSPGGTTIEAVAALEEFGLRNAVLKAVDACVRKSKSM